MATKKRANAVRKSRKSRKAATANPRRTRRLPSEPRALVFAVGTALLPWAFVSAAAEPPPHTTPSGGQYTYGSGTVNPAQTGSFSSGGKTYDTKLQIDQVTDKGTINWNSFTIGSSAWVNFSQPSASSLTVNRVLGSNPSDIFGRMTANGQVFLSNPNGVLFAPSASVDVGALFATTLTISDQDASAGRYNRWSNPGNSGTVVNQGSIITANGYTALAAPQVSNEGLIVAHAGSVTLAAGDRVSLDMIGDGLIKVNVDQAAMNASAINSGRIEADGGNVLLTARSANALLDTVVNNSGVIRANSLVERSGEIVLDGGSAGIVCNSGTLQAAGTDSGTTGGTIKVLGQYVGLFDGTRVDATGQVGGGEILIGGNFHGAGPEQNASRTFVGRDARLNADAVATGDGGNVAIWSNDGTRFYGRISARGGSESGNGGFVEVSGKRYLDYGGLTDTRAPMGSMGTLLLDPDDINIVVGVAGTDVNINCTGGGTCAAPLLGPFTDTVLLAGSVGTLNDGTLNAQLAINNVDVTATGAITSANAVNVNMSGRTLNLNAGSSITLGGTYSNGNLGLNFTTNLNLQANTYDLTGATVIANGGGAGTILGPNEAAAWNISGITGSLSSASGTIDFSGVSTLQGGSAVDTFTLGSASTFNLKGGDGLDVFALGGNWLTGSIAGEAAGGSITGIGSATLTAVGTTAGFNGTSANVSGGFTDISDLSGSGTLQGLDAVSSWATNGTSGTYTSTNALTFSGFGTAQGGNQADTFNVTAATTLNLKGGAGNDVFDIGAALTGSVNGGTGSNTLQGSQISDVTLSGSAADGYAGTTAAVSGGFTNIRTFTGSGAGTLTGENAVSTWNLGASKTYDDNAGNGTLTFSGFANAQGGSQDDTFNVTAATTLNLKGGLGNDVFNVNAALTGSVDGEGGTDTLAGSTSYVVSGANNGTASNLGGFSNIENLTGTAGVDTFTVNVGGSLSGAIDGLAGNDTLNGTAIVDVTLTGSTANGYSGSSAAVTGGFIGINSITGNGAGTLTGENVASTWTLAASKTYNDGGVPTLTFSGFGTAQAGSGGDIFMVSKATAMNLIGGSGNDTFNLNAALTGATDGGAGSDTLQGTQIANVTLTGSGANGYSGSLATAANLSGGFSNIDVISGTGTITGENVASTWTLAASKTYNDGGVATLTFSGFGTAQGGSAADTFNVTAATTLNLKGGLGNDAFNVNAVLSGTVDGEGGTDTLAGSTSYVVSGANGGTASNISAAFSNIENLTGTAGVDSFTFQNLGTLSGNVDGLGGADTVDLNAKVGAVSINLQTANFTGITSTFASIETFVGNDGAAGANTTLTGSNAGATFTLTGANGGTAGGTSFSGVGSLVGGTGTDTLQATSAMWNLTGANRGTVTNLAGTFSGMENLTDLGTGTFNMGAAGSIAGDLRASTNGTMNYTGYGSAVIFSLSGASGTTTAVGGSRFGVTNVIGSGNNDTITGSGATYNLTASNAGNSGALSWSSFENVRDATGGQFNLSLASNNVSGTISSGGAGPASCTVPNAPNCANLNSNTDITSLNVSVPGMLLLTGNANGWNLAGAPQPSGFGATNANANVFFNGACVGGPACGTVITITGSIGATLAQLATQALKDALDTDSVSKQIDYGFAGDVGTTPPMDHRIDETGISTPECFEESRESQPCK